MSARLPCGQGDEAVAWGVLDYVRHLSLARGDAPRGPDAARRPRRAERALPYATRRVAALQRAVLLWVQDMHHACGVALPAAAIDDAPEPSAPEAPPVPPGGDGDSDMNGDSGLGLSPTSAANSRINAAMRAPPSPGSYSTSSSEGAGAGGRVHRMAPGGEPPPSFAALLPALRSGVLLADLAAAATGDKFTVCRARGGALPQRVAENNVRAVCARLMRVQAVGHRYCRDEAKILAGDREARPRASAPPSCPAAPPGA